MDPYFGLARGVAHHAQDGVLILVLHMTGGAVAVAIEQAGHFRREQHRRPARRRFLDRRGQRFGVGGRINPASCLENRDPRHCQAASKSSSLPVRSSRNRSSHPPICRPSMKICGTVIRPPARSTISCLFSPLSTRCSTGSTPLASSNCRARKQYPHVIVIYISTFGTRTLHDFHYLPGLNA